MYKGKTLTELAAEIERQRESKRDFVAPLNKIEMVPADDASGVAIALGDKPEFQSSGNVVALDKRDLYPVRPTAHAQIAEHCGIPKAYYDRMLSDDPSLLAKNVNRWLPAGNGGARLIRTLDGNVRGFLSDRFRTLDNADLAEAVLPVLLEQKLKIVSCDITERRLYIKAFDEEIAREIERVGHDHIVKKDVAHPCFCLSNSEIGYGSVQVIGGMFTDGCTNLAFFNERSMRKFHLGNKMSAEDQVYALLTDKTKRLSDAAVWAQLRDVTKAIFDPSRFENLIERVQSTAAQKIEGDVVKVVEVTGRELGFNEGERKGILKHLIEGGDLSRYGLFNAITRSAEEAADYDRASEIEQAGGRLIELPKNQWEVLAKAA